MVGYAEMVERIRSAYPGFERLSSEDAANDTQKVWGVPGFAGKVGFVTSMSQHFCGSCNRLRLTADGNLKVCLFGAAEISLRDALRRPPQSGNEDNDQSQVVQLISQAVKRKKAKHAGMFELARMKNRPMILIGG